MNDKKNKSYYLDKISKILCKFFFFYFYLYEKLKVNHQLHEAIDQNKIVELFIKELLDENMELFISFFRKLMPYVYKLYKQGIKICPLKGCFSQKLIHNIFKNIKEEKPREQLFMIYFDYFTKKIYEMGNPKMNIIPHLKIRI